MQTKLNQQKRQHRERGQLTGRSRLAPLKKYEDYVKRAKDLSTPPRTSNGEGKASEADLLAAKETADSLSKERKVYSRKFTSELQARLERLSLLQRTFREMQVQRSVMGKGSKSVIGDKSKGLSREDERLNERDLDALELKRLGKTKRKLPEPRKGVSTGARVWKWKAERRR